MAELRFEWDPAKDGANQREHGVSFEEARTVFADEMARFQADPDHSEDEDRFLLLGLSASLRIVVVSHCYRRGDDVVRIISARKATRKERVQYTRGWQR
jgi:uncharacterized protein